MMHGSYLPFTAYVCAKRLLPRTNWGKVLERFLSLRSLGSMFCWCVLVALVDVVPGPTPRLAIRSIIFTGSGHG